MNLVNVILYVGYSSLRTKLTEEEKALLPYVWLGLIVVVLGGLYLTYRSWKKSQNK